MIGQESVKLTGYASAGNINPVGLYVWDTGTLSWIKQTPITGGGGGGGAVTIADGADVAQGSTSDVQNSNTVIGKLKAIAAELQGFLNVNLPADASTETTLASAYIGIGSDSATQVQGDAPGSINAKLRGMSNWFYNVMPSVLRGQGLMADSLPVTIASNQSNVPVNIAASSATLAVSGPLTNTQLRASAVAITANPGEIAQLPAVLIGSRLDVNVGSLFNSMTSVGPKAMADSLAVTIATDQSAVNVQGPVTDAELRASPVPVSGSLGRSWALSSGVDSIAAVQSGAWSVEVNNAGGAAAVRIQDGGNSITVDAPVAVPVFARLSNGATPLIAQQLMAASLPVVIASDQSAIAVTGPLTDAQLRASAVPVRAATPLFRGRANTFRTPGRAGTAGQKILSLFNASGSIVTVTLNKVWVDMYQTVVKAVTVPPPNVRLWAVTVLPTNGTSLTKNKIGGSSTSNASVTVLGDASADGTGSATTLTATLPAGAIITQEFAPRLITAAGYEMMDRLEFFGDGATMTIAAASGIVLFLDYTVATMNPVTDMWTAGLEWDEN